MPARGGGLRRIPYNDNYSYLLPIPLEFCMPRLQLSVRSLVALLLWVCTTLLSFQAQALTAESERQVLTILHLLDYIGVDYGNSVAAGQVVHEGEYIEQREFAHSVQEGIARLPSHSQQAVVQQAAGRLQQQIADKVDAAQISQTTASLSAQLIALYPVTQAPRKAPDVAAAAALYVSQCASCHGVTGAGDGPAGKGLEPAPANFLDAEHAAQRSVFGLFNVITLGVSGTGMASYAQMPELDRWALAFYVSQLSYAQSQFDMGARLWEEGGEVARRMGDLRTVSNLLPSEAAKFDGVEVLAYLRKHPEALVARNDPFAVAHTQLDRSLRAYREGDAVGAQQLALSAYLDGFELAEAQLSQADAALMRRIEAGMMDYRNLLKQGAAADVVADAVTALQAQLDQARVVVGEGAQSTVSSFLGSYIILTREGLEVILVLAAIFTFLRRTERRDALPYVHGGWISALVLGFATWFVSAYLVTISGASREVTEGITALLAAIILLSVGLWLHNKSYSNRWQVYVTRKMQGALSGSNLWGLAFLSFIATYREVFETVLFYRALWDQGQPVPILLGFLAGTVTLLGIGWGIFALSLKLPLKQFFAASSALIVLLAVIFTGHGVAALQEAGWLSQDAVHFVRVPLLGIYPNLQGLLLQATLLVVIGLGFAWNHRGTQPAEVAR